jgi:hypothetical protein
MSGSSLRGSSISHTRFSIRTLETCQLPSYLIGDPLLPRVAGSYPDPTPLPGRRVLKAIWLAYVFRRSHDGSRNAQWSSGFAALLKTEV